jgi:hypothetical protein
MCLTIARLLCALHDGANGLRESVDWRPSNGTKSCSRSTDNGGTEPIATPCLAASCVTGCALQATWEGLGIARGIGSGLQSRVLPGSSSGVDTRSAVPRCTGGRGTRAAKGVVVQL